MLLQAVRRRRSIYDADSRLQCVGYPSRSYTEREHLMDRYPTAITLIAVTTTSNVIRTSNLEQAFEPKWPERKVCQMKRAKMAISSHLGLPFSLKSAELVGSSNESELFQAKARFYSSSGLRTGPILDGSGQLPPGDLLNLKILS